MSERMTLERRSEIREMLAHSDRSTMVWGELAAADLLAELDAMRAELAIHLRSSNEAGAALVQAWRERDEARADLEQIKAQKHQPGICQPETCACREADAGAEQMSTITAADKALMAEVNSDPAALWRLRQKARWEGMSLYGVLSEWGDPRTWPGYPWAALRADEPKP